MRCLQSRRSTASAEDRGLGLILVMLALLILSVLAAAIVFSARSETFASYNYKLDTEADYLAKAGIQAAVNWFRSGRYQAISQSQAPTYYAVTADTSPYSLYTSNNQPVQCKAAAPLCPAQNGAVQLIGYGSGSSNYPSITDAGGTQVATAFASDLVNVRVTADSNNSGTFAVNATLLNYQTVAAGTAPSISTAPIEIWLITSKGTWTGGPNSTSAVATAEEQAVIQAVYTPNFGNALYGYCSLTMQGSSGVCTDSFNSAFGQYGGGNKTVASGACDSSSANVIDSGAGVGANGSVTLGSNVSVAGNVTIGTGAAASCGTGYNGSTGSVLGQVVNGPYQAPPPTPTFRAGFPGSAPGITSSAVLPTGLTWPSMPPFPAPGNAPPLTPHQPCMDLTCNGTSAHPYEINSISVSSNGNRVQLIGGSDVMHPVYYDIAGISESGQAEIDVSGFVVLNVKTTLSITGNGITNGISGVIDIPPEAAQINFAGASASLGGNGAISAVVNAPNASVTLGGGGSKGYMVGAVNAYNVTDQGGYPVHYDLQLNRFGGTTSVMLTSAYSRKKM